MEKKTSTATISETITRTAEDISNYLMPKIVYVGGNDEQYNLVKGAYKWATRLYEYHKADADIYVFEKAPQNILDVIKFNPKKTIYLFFSNNHANHDLRKTLSVTIWRHSKESITSHIRIMLLLKELLYRDDYQMPLLSIDKIYRNEIVKLIKAVMNRRLVLLNVDSERHGEAVCDFMFSSMPAEIKPRIVKNGKLNHSARHQYRYHILIEPDRAQLNQIKDSYFTLINKQPKPLLFIVRRSDAGYDADLDGHNTAEITLAPLEKRKDDSILLAYMAYIKQSHKTEKIKYPSADVISTASEKKTAGQNGFFETMLSELRSERGADTPQTIVHLLNDYDQMSLKNVINRIEEITLNKLYEKTQLVDAVAQAAGIPSVTYFKRMKRLRERPSVLKI